MLYWAQTNAALQTGQYLWAIVPACLHRAAGAAFALLNYAFDEIGEPGLRPVRRARKTPCPACPLSAFGGPPDIAACWGRPAAILKSSELSVAYAADRGGVVAVDRVSFDLAAGEFIGIVGESGCGKSTLLFAIAQLLGPRGHYRRQRRSSRAPAWSGMTDSGSSPAVRWKDLSVVMQERHERAEPGQVDRRPVQGRDAGARRALAGGDRRAVRRGAQAWSASTPCT